MRDPSRSGDAPRAAARAVVFDLDGTLVDTAPGMTVLLNALLAGEGRPTLPVEQVRRFIGDGIVRLVERAFAATGAALPAAAAAGFGARLTAALAAAPPGPGDLYPGVAEGVARLAGAGWRLGICTNKPAEAAERALAATGLDTAIGVLVGGGSLPQRKPDPAPLLAAVQQLGAAADAAVYVGDSEVDGATAAAAGVPLVLVTYGYLRGPVDSVPACWRIDRFAELEAVLAG